MNRCAYYYSYDNGIPADNPSKKIFYFKWYIINKIEACASGYVKDGYCKEGPISREKIKPKPCEKDEDC